MLVQIVVFLTNPKMKKYLQTAFLLLFSSFVFAQNMGYKHELFTESKRWILTNNKIDKNEVFLTSYKKAKLRANTFVMSFLAGGKIEYDYETNFAFKSDTQIQFLDIVTDESSWEFDSLTNQLSLTIKGGYSSLDDFKFKRSYKIERASEGYILHKVGEEFYEDLKLKARNEKLLLAQIKKNEAILSNQQAIIEKKETAYTPPKVENTVSQMPNNQPNIIPKIDSVVLQKTDNQVVINIVPVQSSPILVAEPIVVPVVVIDYAARSRNLLDNSKRWMLVKNKIERNDIFLTTYNESKLTINNLIMTFANDGRIEYDYESDPKVRVCAGVDFLDIDTDETSWTYDSEKNIVTLTLKGGYASLDDFKFKREYWVEIIDDGYILRKLKEHYFTDFRKATNKTRK